MFYWTIQDWILAKGWTEREVPNTISKSQLAISAVDIQLNFWGKGSLKNTISGLIRPPHLQRGIASIGSSNSK